MRTVGESIAGALRNACPRCFEGKVFSGVFKMNPTCPACRLKYEREGGLFSGAIWLGYYLQLLMIFPLYLVLIFKGFSLLYIVSLPTMMLAVMSPIAIRAPRLLGLHFDYRVNAAEYERQKIPADHMRKGG